MNDDLVSRLAGRDIYAMLCEDPMPKLLAENIRCTEQNAAIIHSKNNHELHSPTRAMHKSGEHTHTHPENQPQNLLADNHASIQSQHP
jgi:hypothetical protein